MDPFSAPQPPKNEPTDWYLSYGQPGSAAQARAATSTINEPKANPETKRPRVWLPVTTAATGAALAASLLTAGLTGAFTGEDLASGTPITTNATQTAASASTGNVNWQEVAANVRPAVVAITARTASGGGEGSGVLIDGNGRIVTNHHVVSGAKELSVTLSDGRILPATVLGTDPTTDLAVIELDNPPTDLEYAQFADSDSVSVGDPVMAVGNPLGLDSTVTTGIVSALDRPVSTSGESGDPFSQPDPVVTNAIQIDAAINPGNSGGPLFNAAGEVIGINSSIAAMAGGSSGSIGLGFAIPAAVAQNVSGQLIDDGTVDHARLGVTMTSSSVEVDGVTRRGAKVEQVVEGSAAASAGLQAGDVITAFNGKSVSGAEALTGFVRAQSVGSDIKLTIVRGGNEHEVDVTLASSNPEI